MGDVKWTAQPSHYVIETDPHPETATCGIVTAMNSRKTVPSLERSLLRRQHCHTPDAQRASKHETYRRKPTPRNPPPSRRLCRIPNVGNWSCPEERLLSLYCGTEKAQMQADLTTGFAFLELDCWTQRFSSFSRAAPICCSQRWTTASCIPPTGPWRCTLALSVEDERISINDHWD